MAGSLSHIVTDRGEFRMDLIENLGDAQEALEECFDIIAVLCGGDMKRLRQACNTANSVTPKATPLMGVRVGDGYFEVDEDDDFEEEDED